MIRLAEGDRGAFLPVYEGLYPLIRRWCGQRLPNGADAEDAAQLTLERLFFRAAEFDSARDVLGWALALAGAECRTAVRRKLRRRESLGAGETEPAVEPEAEHAVTRAELRAALATVLAELSPTDVEVLLASVEEGPRPDVPGPTFRKRLERALRRIRALWSERYGLG
jgi:RNA polymerase sigma-70 factor (ECF subfamily)